MNVLKRKLNNQKGASITWALLIFLVCAVVGSAVLVAGTVAAGRMSKLAENDQRYFAVTSTAGLLRDVLGEEVRVTRTEGSSTIKFEQQNQGYNLDPSNPGEPYASLDDEFIQALIQKMMSWTGSSDSDWGKDYISFTTPEELSLTFSSSDGRINNVLSVEKPVTADLFINPDGSLTATVSKDGYSILLSFELERTMESNVDAAGKRTKTDTFRWNLKEAQKVESKASQGE